jgi:hypothetical protein
MLNLILLQISSVCIKFYIGVKFYKKATEGKLGFFLKNKMYIIERLTFLELFLILFILFFLYFYLQKSLTYYIYNNIPNINDIAVYMADNNQPTNTAKLVKDTVDNGGNAAIMGASITAGIKLAQSVPTVAGKLATLGGAIGLGAGAIAAKNIIGNATKNLGKKSNNLLPSITDLDLSEIFGLTGNSVIDLLTMIKFFQKLQFFLLVLILYYLIIYIIDISKLEKFLIQRAGASRPLTKLVLNIIKILNKIKNIGFITIICLIIMCLIAAHLNSTYLEFLFDNLDKLIELYSKNL